MIVKTETDQVSERTLGRAGLRMGSARFSCLAAPGDDLLFDYVEGAEEFLDKIGKPVVDLVRHSYGSVARPPCCGSRR